MNHLTDAARNVVAGLARQRKPIVANTAVTRSGFRRHVLFERTAKVKRWFSTNASVLEASLLA